MKWVCSFWRKDPARRGEGGGYLSVRLLPLAQPTRLSGEHFAGEVMFQPGLHRKWLSQNKGSPAFCFLPSAGATISLHRPQIRHQGPEEHTPRASPVLLMFLRSTITAPGIF